MMLLDFLDVITYMWQSHISVHHPRVVARDEVGQPNMHQLCIDLIQSMGLLSEIYVCIHAKRKVQKHDLQT